MRETPSIQMLGISEGTGHTAGKEQTCGLRVHRILTHVDGVRATQSAEPTLGHTSTLSKVTPPPQTLHLGSHDPWLGRRVSEESPEESPGAPGRVNLAGVKRQTGTACIK